MGERRIIKGYIYEMGEDGTPRPVGPAPGGGQPPRDPAFDFKAPMAQADLAGKQIGNQKTAQEIELERQRMGLDAQKAGDARQKMIADLATQGLEIGSDGQPQRIEGWQPQQQPLSPSVRQEALGTFQSALDLGPLVNDVERTFQRGPGATRGAMGLRDYLPLPANQEFDRTAGKLRGFVKKAQGFTGGEGNTLNEMQLNIGAFIPESKDYDGTTRANIEALRREQQKGLRTSVSVLGGIPDANGNVTPIPRGYTVGQYPELDREVALQINNVPPQQRQNFIINARRKYEERRANKGSPRGAPRSAPRRVIDFNDLP